MKSIINVVVYMINDVDYIDDDVDYINNDVNYRFGAHKRKFSDCLSGIATKDSLISDHGFMPSKIPCSKKGQRAWAKFGSRIG